MSEAKPNLLDFSPAELTGLCLSLGEKAYRGAQLAAWPFRRGVESFDQMTDIAKSTRQKLAAVTRLVHPIAEDVAEDEAGARKILWRLDDGQMVESVLIPEKKHLTLCLSSQVGCALGCRFCCTATMGFTRNLSPGEILGQILGAAKFMRPDEHLTNLVFMGMGEPLLNRVNLMKSLEIITDSDLMAVAQKRVSVSTVGIIPELAHLAKGPAVGLTISLSAPTDEMRNQLMPINKTYPLFDLKKALASYPLPRGRRLTIAYALLNGVNDRPEQALALSRFLTGLKVKINLIPFNPWPGAPFESPEPAAVETFKNILTEKNYTVIVRQSKGRGLAAACGQLRAKRINCA